MKENMRKEVKMGLLLFAIFSIIRYITIEIVAEVPVIHFFLGGLVGLSLVYIIIGSLSEATYLKLKAFKRVC